MGSSTSSDVDHRALGAAAVQRDLDLPREGSRTVNEDDLMLLSANASAYHWRQVGTAANFARGVWQMSRVYSVLGRAEPALHHATRCLQICQENGIGDWDLGFAYEALARAAAVAGDRDAAQAWRDQAYEAAADIAEDEDRDLLLTDLSTIADVSPRS